jgi:hypothetical protein
MDTPYTFAHNAHAGALQLTYAHLSDAEESGVSVNVAGRVTPPARSSSSRSRPSRESLTTSSSCTSVIGWE